MSVTQAEPHPLGERVALRRTSLWGAKKYPSFLTSKGGQRWELLQLLAFGLVPDEELAHRALIRAESARNEWLRDHGSAALDDAAISILLRQAVARVLEQGARRTLTMGITSGFDSRPLLHTLRDLGRSVSLYCYGHPGNIDFDVVSWLSERTELDVHMIDTRTLDFPLEVYEQHAREHYPSPIGPGPPGWREVDRLIPHRVAIHGFLNDTLTGDNREKVAAARVNDDRAAFWARNDPFGLQNLFGDKLLDSLSPGRAVSSERGLDLYRQYDIGYRQYSRIRADTHRHVTHHFLYPFEDVEWMGYWLSRTGAERSGQARWYRWVQSLQSDLFADLDGLDGEGKALRLARKRRFYGWKNTPGLLDFSGETSALQREPAHPFDLRAVYLNNPSFRHTVDESVKRLRGRQVFQNSAIDAITASFDRGELPGSLLMNALVTADVHLEVGKV